LQTADNHIAKIGTGGLSGKPLCNRSTEVIRYIAENSKHAFTIIGVGGIHSPEDALEKITAGASLIQLYSGFIYEGPGLVKKINKKLVASDLYPTQNQIHTG
jgi:dihydroorotate dehydrogenase